MAVGSVAKSVREPVSSEMALMIENIQRAQETLAAEPRPVAPPVDHVEPAPEPPSDVAPKVHHDPSHKRRAHHVMSTAHVVLEVAEMGNILAGAALGGVAGGAVIAVGMAALGATHIGEAMHHRSTEEVIEGTGAMVLGLRSGFSALATSGHLVSHASLVGHAATIAHEVLAPLGVVHGVAEIVLGGKRMWDSVREEDPAKGVAGFLGIGVGASLAVASLGGGIPAMVFAGLFLAGKIVTEESETVKRLLRNEHRTPASTDAPAPSSSFSSGAAASSWQLYNN